MIGRSSAASRSELTPDFRLLFLQRVHLLLAMGYARLTHCDYASSEEEDISGDLADEIEAVLDEPPPLGTTWMRFYSVHNERPEKDRKGKRKGKHRRKVDLRLDSSQEAGPRQRHRFEAKRLYNSNSVSAYLGPEGLGCFLSGSYAATSPTGGMIGYVQTGTSREWVARIQAKLDSSSALYAVRPNGRWQRKVLTQELLHTYHSAHDRVEDLGAIDIFHVLLDFLPRTDASNH